MWTSVLVSSLAVAVMGQEETEDLDPYDLVNYDPNTKKMRPQVSMNSIQAELSLCKSEVVDLQREMRLYNLVITAVVCIQLCAVVCYFLQLRRLFAFSFLPLALAILATVTGFIKEPLKQFGINEFKSFKDLPVNLLICVLLTITLSILHQPPPQQQPQPLNIEERDRLAGRDARVQAGGRQVDGDGNQDRRRPREDPAGDDVETLVAGRPAEAVPNAGQREEQPQAEQNLAADSEEESEDEQEAQELEAGDVEVRAEDESPPDSLTEFKSARVPVQETHQLREE